MRNLLKPRRLNSVAMITAVWCGLWGEVSAANVLAGLLIGVALTVLGVGTAGEGGVRLWPLLRLISVVFVDLIKSMVTVAREIITPTDNTNEAVIGIDIPPEAHDHLLLLSVAITLTPGTAVVDADTETGTLYVHLLHSDDPQETVDHVGNLVRLACEALPTQYEEVTR